MIVILIQQVRISLSLYLSLMFCYFSLFILLFSLSLLVMFKGIHSPEVSLLFLCSIAVLFIKLL